MAVANENFEQFELMYRPIYQKYFKHLCQFENGRFKIDHSNETRLELMNYINDNVFQNVNETSLKLYDKDVVKHKDKLTPE